MPESPVESTVFDAPVSSPGHDLLSMAKYAIRLAEYLDGVSLPFTVGIYGGWGSGKTSFFRLVEHFHKRLAEAGKAKSMQFITFEAWPYESADSLWRALVLRIAEKLYGVPNAATDVAVQPHPPAQAHGPSGGWREWLAQTLSADAVVLLDPHSVPVDPWADYRAFVDQLDGTFYGSVG